MKTDARDTIPLRRVTLDLAPLSMARLERLKAVTDATSYAEVVRAALLDYEERIADQCKRLAPPGKIVP